MKTTNIAVGVVAVLTLLLIVNNFTTSNEAETAGEDGLLLHVSVGVDNPHRVLMPLSLAMKMSETMPVRMFFDIDGATILTKDAENVTYEGFEKGSKELLTALLANENVTIHACPMCMKTHGITPEDLMEGIEVANLETFTGFTDGRIVTLDW